ncbi:MAG: hypothetical protein QOF77_945 [Solirubrobacteraceae bacterium]|nr:hypothetical protein [Solirubrobacteraceae bacterium]
MPYSPPDSLTNRAEGVLLATLLCAYGLVLLVRLLGRSRPEFRPANPLAAAFALRVAAIGAVAASGLGATLRGGDELGFVANARLIASLPFSSGLWVPGGTYNLHEVVFALQLKLGDLGESALRVTQVGISVCGLLLLAAAVHDLAGPRPGRLVLWLLALEPASIFFSQILHKEPLMVLASGLVALGGARAWRKVDAQALAILAAGSAVAILTRPYAGWFLASAAVAIVLHATVRDATRSLSAFAVLVGVLIGIAAAVPVIVQVTSKESLQANLQPSQTANTTTATAPTSGPNANNLALESVDYSTRSAIITNLPIRISDLVLRPYPWQLANTSEQLGVLGTLVAFATLVALLRYGMLARRSLVRLVGPLLYPLGFLLIAYALSVGNAGTGFRYRSHLVTLGLAVAVVLREYCLAAAPQVLRTRSADAVRGNGVVAVGPRPARARGWPRRLA